MMSNKIFTQARELGIRDRELNEVDKMQIMNHHLNIEVEETKRDNKLLKSRNQLMKDIMLGFDFNSIDLQNEDDVLTDIHYLKFCALEYN